LFFNDIRLNWFEFSKINEPNLHLGMKVSGNRNIVINESLESMYVPLERPGKLSVKVKSAFGNNEYELDCNDIKTKKDYSIIAMFNCNSFKSLSEVSKEIGFARIIEKIEVKAEKKAISKL
jgi:hypothetical protein